MEDPLNSIPDYAKKAFVFICVFIIFSNLLLQSCIKIIGTDAQWGVLILLLLFIYLIYKMISSIL